MNSLGNRDDKLLFSKVKNFADSRPINLVIFEVFKKISSTRSLDANF
jgi:hypothetical protein